MQPYQQANEEQIRQRDAPYKMLGKAAGIGLAGASAIGGSALASKALTFLNEYIPEDFAIKGLSKLDPRLGKFIQTAKSGGQTFDEIRSFVADKAEKAIEADQKNLIQKHSPELHMFLEDQIKSGLSPLQAGAKATVDKKFSEAINKLTKEYKLPWSKILESVYGASEEGQKIVNNTSKMPQNNQGGIDPQLMQILQQGQALLQKFKGA